MDKMISISEAGRILGVTTRTLKRWDKVQKLSMYRTSPEDVYADEEGCQTMRALGRNMAFLIKSIQLGKEKFGLPEKEERKFTSFSSIR